MCAKTCEGCEHLEEETLGSGRKSVTARRCTNPKNKGWCGRVVTVGTDRTMPAWCVKYKSEIKN